MGTESDITNKRIEKIRQILSNNETGIVDLIWGPDLEFDVTLGSGEIVYPDVTFGSGHYISYQREN